VTDEYKVLWVEDSALQELAYLAGPVYLDGEFDLIVALDVSEAMDHLQNTEFQAIIVDIRLPPGENREWCEIYEKAGQQKATASLGLRLLKTLLKTNDSEVKLDKPLVWLTPEKVGIFTVESNNTLQKALDELGIQVFQHKYADMPETILLDLVKKLCHPKA
jgi:hypothetical protein